MTQAGDTNGSGQPYRTRYLKLRSVLHDRNTDLPAFPLLFDRLRTALDGRRGVGVLHVELANLEMVESLYGWQVFDRIVARVARLLREAVGRELPGATLLALNGVAGDRFVLFLPQREDGSEPDGAWLGKVGGKVGRKLERALDSAEFVGLSPKLCARVGHALLLDNPFYRFERCVYSAVEQAREAPERRERRRELSWGEELEQIIQSATVATVFQPIVELAGRELLGHEACARGPLDSMFESPRAMFALGGRVGVSAELDRLCRERALLAFSAGLGAGKLFVNALSTSFALGEGHAERLRATLGELEIAPGDLVLEFSERGADADPDPFCERLERIREKGFAIAIDDVGTGRAGLQTIERVQPDYVKLDASLVRNIQDNLIQQELLLTLARLAERIGAAVIAEGIETPAEAAAVAQGGARYGQGFHFAHPSAQLWPGPAERP